LPKGEKIIIIECKSYHPIEVFIHQAIGTDRKPSGFTIASRVSFVEIGHAAKVGLIEWSHWDSLIGKLNHHELKTWIWR